MPPMLIASFLSPFPRSGRGRKLNKRTACTVLSKIPERWTETVTGSYVRVRKAAALVEVMLAQWVLPRQALRWQWILSWTYGFDASANPPRERDIASVQSHQQ
jgi:hypothetical protein